VPATPFLGDDTHARYIICVSSVFSDFRAAFYYEEPIRMTALMKGWIPASFMLHTYVCIVINIKIKVNGIELVRCTTQPSEQARTCRSSVHNVRQNFSSQIIHHPQPGQRFTQSLSTTSRAQVQVKTRLYTVKTVALVASVTKTAHPLPLWLSFFLASRSRKGIQILRNTYKLYSPTSRICALQRTNFQKKITILRLSTSATCAR
jgi:hypothetical protein